MNTQLQYQLAGAELRRAAQVTINLTATIPTTLAMLELLEKYLADRPLSPSARTTGTRATVLAFRQTTNDLIASMQLENVLRRGETLSTAIAYPNASAASLFVIYNACLGGAHSIGKLTAASWAVRVEVNRFLQLIDGQFPTMAELLLLAQNGELRTDAPDPAAFATGRFEN
jgi:hypothetical protein